MKTWHPEEGWGFIGIEGVAGDCFAHFSCIAQREHEFLELGPGEQVLVSWHEGQQDDFSIVADRVERLSEDPPNSTRARDID